MPEGAGSYHKAPSLWFSRPQWLCCFSDGYAECCEAVQDGDTDLELGNLTVEVPSGQTLAQQFDAAHPIVGKTIPRIVF